MGEAQAGGVTQARGERVWTVPGPAELRPGRGAAVTLREHCAGGGHGGGSAERASDPLPLGRGV